MELKLLKKLEKIIPLHIGIKDSYLFDKNQTKIYKTTNFENELWSIELEGGGIYINGEYIILIQKEEGTYYLDRKTGEFQELEDFFLLDNNFNDEYELDKILVYKNLTFENHRPIYDLGFYNAELDKFEIIKSSFVFDQLYLFDNNYIVRNLKVLSFYNSDFEKLWQYSLEEIPNFIEFNEEIETKVEQFLGVYDNKLWIHLNGERLLALDTETGKQVYLLKNIYKGHGKNFLNKERGVIQILAGHHYGEFDLHQLKYTTEVKLDKEEKVFIRSCTFYENNPLIYFCGRYNHIGFPNSYGIFDSEKLEIVWYKIGEKKQYFLDPPKANDKNLVILDNQLNLYIYEIEYD